MARVMAKRVFQMLVAHAPGRVKRLVPGRVKQWMKSRYARRNVLIDIVGSCNLECPSCPSGAAERNPGGMMSLETFERIIDRVASEYPGTTVDLFNWTEPLLHPQIAQFVQITRAHRLRSSISTNLNILRDPDALAAAQPESITVSLSGFTQPVYVIGHKGGDVERVKGNMVRLSHSLLKAGSRTRVEVYFHKYRHNLHEVSLMREYASSLGFLFKAGWAYYMPIERVRSYVEGTLPGAEREFVESRFALNIKRAVEATEPFRHEPCALISSSLALDCRGTVQLCCAVYNSKKFSIGSLLDTPTETIEKKILTHPYCDGCMRNGLHIYALWHEHEIRSEYERIAREGSGTQSG